MNNLTGITLNIIKVIYYFSISCFIFLMIFGILISSNLISTKIGDHKFIVDYKLNKPIVINQNGKIYSELENLKVKNSPIIIEKIKVELKLKNQIHTGIIIIIFAIIVYGTVILISKSLVNIINQIKNKDPFTLNTIKDIKAIGFIILLITPISIILKFCSTFIFNEIISENEVDYFHNLVYHFDLFFLNSIIPGLIILILAEVFKSGLELKKEQELTV